MSNKKATSENKIHHAYLMIGEASISFDYVNGFLHDFGINISGNPDIQSFKYNTLTIDIARDLSLSVAQRSFSKENEGKKIFIIETNIITEEAQNALLKVFEEPTSGTHFFIIMPQDILLPTLRSRMQIIQAKENLDKKSLNILKRSISERLLLVKEITDAISDEEKTKQDAITLLNEVESELYSRGVEKEFLNLRICEDTRKALYDRGTPVKMVLENLMLSI